MSALESLTLIHRRSISFSQQTDSTAVSTTNSDSAASSSYAESTFSNTWSSDDDKDDQSITTSDSSCSSDREDVMQDSPRHEPGWRGSNSIMPPPSSIAPTLPLSDSFDSPQDVDFIPNLSDPYSLKHSEYGYDVNPAHRTTSICHPDGSSFAPVAEEPPLLVFFQTYCSYAMLIMIGHLRDFIGKLLFPGDYQHLKPHEVSQPVSPRGRK